MYNSLDEVGVNNWPQEILPLQWRHDGRDSTQSFIQTQIK